MSVNLFTKARGHFNAIIIGSPSSDGGPAVGSPSPSLLKRLVNAAVVINPGANIAANTAFETTDITLAGVAVGDQVHVTPPAGIEAGLVWTAYVTGAGTFRVRIANVTVGAVTTASRTWQVEWHKFV